MKLSCALVCAGFFLSAGADAGDSVRFITFGDWGGGTSGQKAVADAATAYCATHLCEFVLTLGDNFYPAGVRSVRDPKWQTYYKEVYSGLHLPFYAVIGNHDEDGNVRAQMDYSTIDSSWHMPGRYYSVTFPQKSDRPVVEIFVIDNGDDELEPVEQAWLAMALAQSRAAWKILAIHKPVISNGYHGDNSSGINDRLVPVICSRVDVMLSGHEHSFSHLRGPWKGCMMDQVIAGTGGMTLRKVDTKDPRVISTGSFYGFGWLSATRQTLTFRMIRTDGSVFYEAIWKKGPS